MKVLVVSESFIMRDSLTEFFNAEFSVNEVKSFSNLECLSKKDLSECDFLFIDVNNNNNNINISETLKTAKNKSKNIKVIILDYKKDIELFLKVLNYGVDGYILNITDRDEFTYIIKKVMNGKKFYDSELLQYRIQKDKLNNNIDLTSREKSVLSYVCKGLSNKDIADKLKVTDYTIKKHVSNILSKLNLRNRQDIIIYAKDSHLINEII